MVIVHIAPGMPYNEGWSYHENLLPKYQSKMGNTVTLITTDMKQQDGKIINTGCMDYINDAGVRVIRKRTERIKIPKIGSFLCSLDIKQTLEELQPDFIFFHSMVNATIFKVVRFKKKAKKKVIIVQDNHLDYNIGFNPYSNIKSLIMTSLYRIFYKVTMKSIAVVYGVTPWRKQYAERVFKVPKEKTDVLIMGADDEEIDFINRDRIRNTIRETLGISKCEFCILTGGKIDLKKKIDLLMDACKKLRKVKLIVFGSVSYDMKDRFDCLINSTNIIYVGWINSKQFYDYCLAADLAFFPGQHSVLWEQACATKIPCVFSRWEGMDHVNNGGNADFLTEISVEAIERKIQELMFTNKYYEMKQIAESEKTDIFLYSNIAKKSLEFLDSF